MSGEGKGESKKGKLMGREGREGFVDYDGSEGMGGKMRRGKRVEGNGKGPPGPEAETSRVGRVRGGGAELRLESVKEGEAGRWRPHGEGDEGRGEGSGKEEREVFDGGGEKERKSLAGVDTHP